eukprot:COSAG01_NODE_6552_length_3611_cov_3.623292_3_plen_168_part_00
MSVPCSAPYVCSHDGFVFQRQTTPRQTTRKGRTGGTDGRQFSLTPTVKAAPFAALRTHPVITCEPFYRPDTTKRWYLGYMKHCIIENYDGQTSWFNIIIFDMRYCKMFFTESASRASSSSPSSFVTSRKISSILGCKILAPPSPSSPAPPQAPAAPRQHAADMDIRF